MTTSTKYSKRNNITRMHNGSRTISINGEKLRAVLRSQHDYSTGDICQLTGVSKTYWSYATSHNRCNYDAFIKLCKLLRIRVDDYVIKEIDSLPTRVAESKITEDNKLADISSDISSIHDQLSKLDVTFHAMEDNSTRTNELLYNLTRKVVELHITVARMLALWESPGSTSTIKVKTDFVEVGRLQK